MPGNSDAYQKLGYFSETVAADRKRKEYDIKNHSIVRTGRRPDFLFIGDSITQYWELNAYFDEPGQLLINRGSKAIPRRISTNAFLSTLCN